MAVSRKALCVALLGVLSFAFLGLSGCGGGSGGGGGGGGGGGNGGSFLVLVANSAVQYGNTGPGGTNQVAYPTDPGAGVPVPAGSPTQNYQVPQPVFQQGAIGTQTFLSLTFNQDVLASSISSFPPTGFDGITVFVTVGGGDPTPPCLLSAGSPVCMKLDSTGIIDPSNLVVGDRAPAVLRLYYDPDDNLTTPDALPNGDYLIVITNALKAFNGAPFCVGNGSSSCSNSYLPSIPFTVGPNTTPLDLATTAIVPVPGEAAAPINSEIIINFIDSVDMGSIVGGTANLTTLDPFISIPFMLGGMAPQPNIAVAYTAPTDPVTGIQQTLPASLGFVIYMPDPKLAPTQIRIRFVDITTLQGVNNPAGMIYQNYASNPQKYPIQSSDPSQGGALLQLPAIKAVPGSFLGSNLVVGPATVTITPNGMITDRANLPGGMGNPYLGAFVGTFTFAVGPALSRNPVPPDATFVGSPLGGPVPFDKPGITVVNTANTTGSNTVTPCTNIPAWAGVPVTGVLTPLPITSRIANTQVLGIPGDMEVGTFLNQGGFGITDSPRGTLVPGVPDDQNGMAPSGILNCINPMIPAPTPPYGNRLYVTDLTAGALKVFNSYDFTLMTVIPGVASPRGLGMAPDLGYLYVSNELQGTIQRININPASPQFHTITNTVTVGSGPRAISVMPSNEDVFVCNFNENSISIVRPNTQTERAKFPTGMGPSDIFLTFRMLGQGLTNEYMGFIPNVFSNSVSVYESAGGGVVLENLPQGRMVAQVSGFIGPARGTWNWRTYIGFTSNPGAFIANTFGGSVSHLYLQNFTLSPPPGFPGPAGTRTFVNDGVFTVFNSPSDASIDNMSGLYNFNVLGISNNKGAADPSVGGGVPSVVLVSYPSVGKIVAYDYSSPAFFSEVSVPGCEFLQAYYDQ